MQRKNITITFHNQADEDLGTRFWPAVPRAGDSVYFRALGRHLVVDEVSWGDCVRGDGAPIPDEGAVAVVLREIPLDEQPLRVWRVFNGMVANGPVHRIVVARSAVDAVAAAQRAGLSASTNGMRAEPVCLASDGHAESNDSE